MAGSQFEDYAPAGLTQLDKERLCEEGKLFASIPGTSLGSRGSASCYSSLTIRPCGNDWRPTRLSICAR
jgi:hypothetical protein